MNTYSHKRSIGIVLIVCAMIFSLIAVTTLIDARQKKRSPGTVSPSGEINTWWDDVTDYMDAEELIKRFLKSIGALKKTRVELEKEKNLQKLNSVRADNLAKDWEEHRSAKLKQYDESYIRYTDAGIAISKANYTIICADEDIAKVNYQLYAISRRSWRYQTGHNYYEMIEKLEQQKADLIAKRDAAKADIPMQEAIILTEFTLMVRLGIEITKSKLMIDHFINREKFHDEQIDKIDKKIDAIDAQEAAEQAELAKLQSDYAGKDDDEQAGPGESPGLYHTSSDTTIDFGETHSFKAITEVYYDVNWYIQKKGETGLGKRLYANSGGSETNKAEVNIAFSSDNGIKPYTDYVITARVKRLSDKTTYDLTYDVSIGP